MISFTFWVAWNFAEHERKCGRYRNSKKVFFITITICLLLKLGGRIHQINSQIIMFSLSFFVVLKTLSSFVHWPYFCDFSNIYSIAREIPRVIKNNFKPLCFQFKRTELHQRTYPEKGLSELCIFLWITFELRTKKTTWHGGNGTQ